MDVISSILVMGNFLLIVFALYFNVKVLRDQTKKDFILPWKFTFVALLFFLVFEIIGVLEGMGLMTLWGVADLFSILYGVSRIGIVGAFLFGLILEDKHEVLEEKQIVRKMLKTKRERHEISSKRRSSKKKSKK